LEGFHNTKKSLIYGVNFIKSKPLNNAPRFTHRETPWEQDDNSAKSLLPFSRSRARRLRLSEREIGGISGGISAPGVREQGPG